MKENVTMNFEVHQIMGGSRMEDVVVNRYWFETRQEAEQFAQRRNSETSNLSTFRVVTSGD